jgi:hypothetical protein
LFFLCPSVTTHGLGKLSELINTCPTPWFSFGKSVLPVYFPELCFILLEIRIPVSSRASWDGRVPETFWAPWISNSTWTVRKVKQIPVWLSNQVSTKVVHNFRIIHIIIVHTPSGSIPDFDFIMFVYRTDIAWFDCPQIFLINSHVKSVRYMNSNVFASGKIHCWFIIPLILGAIVSFLCKFRTGKAAGRDQFMYEDDGSKRIMFCKRFDLRDVGGLSDQI